MQDLEPSKTRDDPPVPSWVNTPLSLGGVPMPSRWFLAPLAGYTGLPYRLVVRELGGLGLATTDLVNARSLLEGTRKSLELVETRPEDRPVAMQLYGSKTDEMTVAGRKVADLGATIVDINMGCPVRKVVRTGGGSALMCEADNAIRLVESMVKAVPAPITVKMRLGWDETQITAPALARGFESVGAAAVIIHGRTRAQGFQGRVNLEGIRAVVEAVDAMPVVGNGDVRTIADAEEMFRVTGCAAISIGRGALGNPFFFRQLTHWMLHGHPGPCPTFEERLEVMTKHFHGIVDQRGERIGCLQFRKITRWYNHLIRPPRTLYLRLVNIASRAVFDEIVAAIADAGPQAPLLETAPTVPVPHGPMDKW